MIAFQWQSRWFDRYSVAAMLVALALSISDGLARTLFAILPAYDGSPLPWVQKSLFAALLLIALIARKWRPLAAVAISVVTTGRVVEVSFATNFNGALVAPTLLLVPLILLRPLPGALIGGTGLGMACAGIIYSGIAPALTQSLVIMHVLAFTFLVLLRTLHEYVYRRTLDLERKDTSLVTTAARLTDKQRLLLSVTLHEVKTPVATMRILLDDMHATHPSPRHEALREQIETLIDLVDEAGSLAGNVASAERFGPARLFSVPESVEQALANFRHQFAEREIAVSLRGRYDSASRHMGRARLIRHLVSNLLALLYRRDATRDLEITLGQSVLPDHCSRFHIVARYAKPAGKRDTFFDAPYTLDLSDGAGREALQAAAMKELVQLLPDGDLSIFNHSVGGARLELTFTLHHELELMLPEVEVATDAEVIAGQHILLVEDMPVLRRLASKLLTQEGASVTAAMDGVDALSLLKQSSTQVPVDAVLTDLLMPRMGGLELAATLRQQGFTGPIIGLSSASFGEDADQFLAAGANGVLAKPLDIAQLRNTLVLHSKAASRGDNSRWREARA